LSQKRTFGDKWQRFFKDQMPSCPTNTAKALKETRCTDLSQWPGLVLSSGNRGKRHCCLYADSSVTIPRIGFRKFKKFFLWHRWYG